MKTISVADIAAQLLKAQTAHDAALGNRTASYKALGVLRSSQQRLGEAIATNQRKLLDLTVELNDREIKSGQDSRVLESAIYRLTQIMQLQRMASQLEAAKAGPLSGGDTFRLSSATLASTCCLTVFNIDGLLSLGGYNEDTGATTGLLKLPADFKLVFLGKPMGPFGRVGKTATEIFAPLEDSRVSLDKAIQAAQGKLTAAASDLEALKQQSNRLVESSELLADLSLLVPSRSASLGDCFQVTLSSTGSPDTFHVYVLEAAGDCLALVSGGHSLYTIQSTDARLVKAVRVAGFPLRSIAASVPG